MTADPSTAEIQRVLEWAEQHSDALTGRHGGPGGSQRHQQRHSCAQHDERGPAWSSSVHCPFESTLRPSRIKQGFSANAHPHTARTRERSGLDVERSTRRTTIRRQNLSFRNRQRCIYRLYVGIPVVRLKDPDIVNPKLGTY